MINVSLENLRGITRKFAGNGRKLGYPTANLVVNTQLMDGVYFGYANLGGYVAHPTLIFIGTPTTVGDVEHRIEAHLLNIVDQDYYGLELELDVQHFYRTNTTFDSVDDLIAAMKDDEIAARQWFNK